MKKFFLLIILYSMHSSSWAMLVKTLMQVSGVGILKKNFKKPYDRGNSLMKLSESQEIKARICAIGLQHFVEKTQLCKYLGGQVCDLAQVACDVQLALHDYEIKMKSRDPQAVKVAQWNELAIIKAVVRNSVVVESVKKDYCLE